MKVTQSCSICDSMGCRPPGSSVHGILRARILECIAILFLPQRIFLTQGSNLGLLNCGQILCYLSLYGLDSYLRYTPSWFALDSLRFNKEDLMTQEIAQSPKHLFSLMSHPCGTDDD